MIRKLAGVALVASVAAGCAYEGPPPRPPGYYYGYSGYYYTPGYYYPGYYYGPPAYGSAGVVYGHWR